MNVTHGKDCAAVGVGVPGFLVDLQRPLGRQQADEGRHLGGQVVDLVSVLAGGIFATYKVNNNKLFSCVK